MDKIKTMNEIDVLCKKIIDMTRGDESPEARRKRKTVRMVRARINHVKINELAYRDALAIANKAHKIRYKDGGAIVAVDGRILPQRVNRLKKKIEDLKRGRG